MCESVVGDVLCKLDIVSSEQYAFRVSAKNMIGSGDYSALSYKYNGMCVCVCMFVLVLC